MVIQSDTKEKTIKIGENENASIPAIRPEPGHCFFLILRFCKALLLCAAVMCACLALLLCAAVMCACLALLPYAAVMCACLALLLSSLVVLYESSDLEACCLVELTLSDDDVGDLLESR